MIVEFWSCFKDVYGLGVFVFLQDLFWSRVFWGFCNNEVFLSFLVFKRAFYLIYS